MITNNQKNRFNENGYLVINNFFSKKDIERFTLTVKMIIKYFLKRACDEHSIEIKIPAGGEISYGMIELKKLNNKYVSQIANFLQLLPEKDNLVSNPKFKDYSNLLLELETDNPLFVTNNGVVVQMPKDKDQTYSWHKEHFTTVPFSRYIQYWAPLIEDSKADMGTIVVCPKSHLTGWKGQKFIQHKRMSKSFVIPKIELDKYEKKQIEMKLGDLLIMSPGLIHKSGNNNSNKCRFSLVALYHKIINPEMEPPLIKYEWQGKSPIDYYNELYNQ